jgi:hypothetical protein
MASASYTGGWRRLIKMEIPPIPERYVPGFNILINLTDEQVESFVNALSKAKPALNPAQLAEQLEGQVVGLDEEDIEEILLAVGSIYSLRDILEEAAPHAENFISDSVRETDGIIIPESWDDGRFVSMLKRILAFEPALGITVKAMDLLRDHERMFCSARMITDIRPIFPQDVKKGPGGSVIVHQLKISYHQDSDIKEFFVAMDSEDIAELKRILERAAEKSQVIKKQLSFARIPYLDFT